LRLQLRVLVHLMLCHPPGDSRGGYGKDKQPQWVYECKVCSYRKPRGERAVGKDVPRCKEPGHGQMVLPEEGD